MDELSFASASELARKIRDRELSSREALDHFLARIERLNGPVNAVVTLDAEGARARADELDVALARGEVVGPLHGVPMTIKDAYEVAGVRTTGGIPHYAEHVPDEDAVAVARLRAAGAVIFGKTNVPAFSSDLQTYNDIFGTTNNPHDLTRTPGGSSGGAAAALAAGLTGLELGSDIAGSIRTPANWCGVYGHKPTHGIVPLRGHIPGPPGMLGEADLNVGGPLARSAEDLALVLDIVAGSDARRAKAWSLELPPARRDRLADYRVAAWLDDQTFPVDSSVRGVLEQAVESLRGAGVTVDDRARPGPSLQEMHRVYLRLLAPILVSGVPKAVTDMLEQVVRELPPGDDSLLGRFARAAVDKHGAWIRANERRAQYGARWASLFEQFDVLLAPVGCVPAIPHQQEATQIDRTVEVDGQPRPYLDLFGWVGPATMCHLPATCAPVGRTPEGLPVGIQIIGPYLEDRTPLDFARRMAEVVGGFSPPDGY